MIDLTRRRFGRLIVIQRVDKNKWGKSQWLCKCDCGNEKIVTSSDLRSGSIKSCRCLLLEGNNIKHGHTKNSKPTKTYKSWASMKQRCTNPKNKKYTSYGGRGIKVCDRWMKFPNFLEDMGEHPGLGYSLDRIKNKLGYYKENCKWATRKDQARNRRDNLYVTYHGKQRLLIELCEEHNMSYVIVYNRIYSYGWSIKEALTIPIGQCRKENSSD